MPERTADTSKLFKERDALLTTCRRKTFNEVFDRFSRLEIIQQRLPAIDSAG